MWLDWPLRLLIRAPRQGELDHVRRLPWRLYFINASVIGLAAFVLPHILLANLANLRVQGRYRHSFWAEVYESVLAWYVILPTTIAFFSPKHGRFNVTGKGVLVAFIGVPLWHVIDGYLSLQLVPAAIRLLRADCGQEPHEELYSSVQQACHIFAALQREGYTPQVALNHDGQFDDFIGDVLRNIGVPGVKPTSLEGVQVGLKAFDDSPVRDDFATLDHWWNERLKVPGPVALYYNTITLHDGNHMVGSKMSSLQSYPLRLAKLLSEIDKFADVVQASGRKAVLVFVPEHGAALEGEPGQIAGLRDIPTPKIINLPVGVRLINFTGKRGSTQVINQPSSYLALAQLLANMVANSPFKPSAPPLSQYAENLPQTEMVGENEGIVTLATPHGYAMRNGVGGKWVVQNE